MKFRSSGRDLFPTHLDVALARLRVHASVDEAGNDAIDDVRIMARDAIAWINRSAGQRNRRMTERIQKAQECHQEVTGSIYPVRVMGNHQYTVGGC